MSDVWLVYFELAIYAPPSEVGPWFTGSWNFVSSESRRVLFIAKDTAGTGCRRKFEGAISGQQCSMALSIFPSRFRVSVCATEHR